MEETVSKRSEADILRKRSQLSQYISKFKDHTLNINEDGSDIGNDLEIE